MDPFIFEYTVNANTNLQIPIRAYGFFTVDVYIDWGDGTVDHVTSDLPSHVYANAGVYQVSIEGHIPRLDHYNYSDGRYYLTKIVRWSKTYYFAYFAYAFYYCWKITEVPPLEGVHTYYSWFNGAFAGLSSVTGTLDMSGMLLNDNDHYFNSCIYASDFTKWVLPINKIGSFIYACMKATKLEEVVFQPNTLIGNITMAFQDTPALTTVNWEDTQLNDVAGLTATFLRSNVNPDIHHWDVQAVTGATDFLTDCNISTINYSTLLINWSCQTLISGVVMDAPSAKYYRSVQLEKDNIPWTINDAGPWSAECSYYDGLNTLPDNIGTLRNEVPYIYDVDVTNTINCSFMTWTSPPAYANVLLLDTVSGVVNDRVRTYYTSGLTINIGKNLIEDRLYILASRVEGNDPDNYFYTLQDTRYIYYLPNDTLIVDEQDQDKFIMDEDNLTQIID